MNLKQIAQAILTAPKEYQEQGLSSLAASGDLLVLASSNLRPLIWHKGAWVYPEWEKDAPPVPTFHQGRLLYIDGKRVKT